MFFQSVYLFTKLIDRDPAAMLLASRESGCTGHMVMRVDSGFCVKFLLDLLIISKTLKCRQCVFSQWSAVSDQAGWC
jgi:hypothetical protein